MTRALLKSTAFILLLTLVVCGQTPAPKAAPQPTPEATAGGQVSTATIISETMETTPEFGPVVSAYLDYLQNEQEVTDDRASRHEIAPAYYRRNTNRIRALRSLALRLARESHNDYMPELVAVTRDEFKTIFLQPPKRNELRSSEIYAGTFRFIGSSVSGGEIFYIFARLDPYEQEEWRQQQNASAHKKKPPEP